MVIEFLNSLSSPFAQKDLVDQGEGVLEVEQGSLEVEECVHLDLDVDSEPNPNDPNNPLQRKILF